MLVRGQQVGRYEVLELVGHGGMASVYRVRHLQLGSIHALKLLDVHKQRVRERLLQEGRTQAILRHPNVVQVTDVLSHEGAPVLVMEYVDGLPLDAWIQRHGTPDLATALTWFHGLTQGLRAAHAMGVVHRDLKPANVLLQPTPAGMRPRLVDFGLVKVLREDRGEGALTRGGVAMGTPEFMAPEQIRDAANVDHRADLYSLGCLLYLLICGRLPYEGRNLVELLTAVGAGRYPRPSTLTPHVPEALERLVVRLLAADPDDRPASCDEVLEQLGRPDLLLPTGSGKLAPASLQAAAQAADPERWALHYGRAPTAAPLRLPRRPLPLRVARGAAPLLLPLALALFAVGAAAPPILPVVQPGRSLSELEEQAPPSAPAVIAPPAPAETPPPAPPPRAPPVVPAGQPDAEAPQPVGGWIEVSLDGDASRVWLMADGARHRVPGVVPPGVYDVLAIFPGTEPVTAGHVEVGAEAMALRCSAFAQRCVTAP